MSFSAPEGYAQAHAITPGAAVKEKVFAEINKVTAAPVVNIFRRQWNNFKSPFHFICLEICGSSKCYLAARKPDLPNYTYYKRYADTSDQSLSSQKELEQQKELAQSMYNDMSVMSDMNARPVTCFLDSTKDNSARIYWMKRHR